MFNFNQKAGARRRRGRNANKNTESDSESSLSPDPFAQKVLKDKRVLDSEEKAYKKMNVAEFMEEDSSKAAGQIQKSAQKKNSRNSEDEEQ
jgi:hypothetical protein